MKWFVLVLVLAFGFGLVARAAEAKKDAPATTQPTTKPVAVNKFCAVEQDDEIDPKVPTIVYKGKVIGFCCEDCAPKFLKNPEKYLKTMK